MEASTTRQGNYSSVKLHATTQTAAATGAHALNVGHMTTTCRFCSSKSILRRTPLSLSLRVRRNEGYNQPRPLVRSRSSGSDNGRVSGSLQESREDVGVTEPGAVFDLRSIRKALVSGPAFDLLVWQSC